MNALATTLEPEIIASLVTKGDLGGLTPVQRVSYYNYRCQQADLDPAAKPFDLLQLNGKLVLYANATATQQLCARRKLTVEIVSKDRVDDLYVVCVRVTDKDGRASDNMGAVPTGGLKGEALSNALMKATTKAIRRTVLAHCGLGMLDETEVVTIPNATLVANEQAELPAKRDLGPHPDTTEVPPHVAEKYADGFRVHLRAENPVGVYHVYRDLEAEGEEVSCAAWKLLGAPERRKIKEYVAQQRASV